ncbi:ferritin-like domain-containing protein [Williamsia sp. CHRR-6]|uniref:ferritin-like domain-containing protein n=1 Tax=Williamsia sp. CHRR-6 TaxID=2835871 RepID=UPI001BD99505|nr:ferritin-like domain-containing protein [Williamsia sp. CHRR-6]MBT0568405.1 ferritin-like domain-containing protein [Williamsia sp. CHRR-6]
MSEATDAIVAAIGAQDAAIFTYGIAAAYAAAGRRSTLDEYLAEHRSRRDELARLLAAAQVAVPVAAPGYVLPVEVTGPTGAVQAMLAAEQDCARAWRSMVERCDQPQQRGTAVAGLSDAARRAATWRLALRITPATVALPGT